MSRTISSVTLFNNKGSIGSISQENALDVMRGVYAKGCEYVGSLHPPRTLDDWKSFVWEFYPSCKIAEYI